MYFNARSIVSKLPDLQILVDDDKPDVILITESWCNNNIMTSLLNLDGYTLETGLRRDREDTRNGVGGGLLVYCKTGILLTPGSKSSNFNQYCEFAIECQTKQNLNVALVYRPPNSNTENIDELCNYIRNSPKNSLLIGDFNFPAVDWSTNSGNDAKSRKFVEAINDRFLTQLVQFPTHRQGNILDLVLTDLPDQIQNIENLGNLGNSDHSIISVEIAIGHSFIETTEYLPDWKRGDVEGLNSFFSATDWSGILSDKNTYQA